MSDEERAKYKQSAIDARAHRTLEHLWAGRLCSKSLYSTIGELDLVTQSQRENTANRMRQMLGLGIIGIYNNDDQQSLRELDDVVTLHGERYHVMADNDYTTLSIARLAMDAGFFFDGWTVAAGRGVAEVDATVVFLTTTDGVLEDVTRDDSASFDELSSDEARQVADVSLEHATSSTSNGGMYSKLHCAATIADETGARVVIAQGKGRHALARALAYESGTEIYSNK